MSEWFLKYHISATTAAVSIPPWWLEKFSWFFILFSCVHASPIAPLHPTPPAITQRPLVSLCSHCSYSVFEINSVLKVLSVLERLTAHKRLNNLTSNYCSFNISFFFNLVFIPSLTLFLRSFTVSVKQESLFVIYTEVFELSHLNGRYVRYGSVGFINENCLRKYVCFI